MAALETHNPALSGYYADPDILFSQKTGKFYLYPTSDGFNGWSGTYFKTFSSPDLVHWKDEGVILDLPRDVSWEKTHAWAPTVTKAETRANADYMARYLKASGWGYVVVNIRWYVGNDAAHGYNEKDPDWQIDEFGRFVPTPNRFPSATNGQGFRPLADYLRRQGLKLGTPRTAADIYPTAGRCPWLHDTYTVVARLAWPTSKPTRTAWPAPTQQPDPS